MRKSSVALPISLALAVGAFGPAVVSAEHHPHHSPPRPVVGPPFIQHRFPPFAVRHFPTVVFAATPLVYPPVVYTPPPAVYYSSPPLPPPPVPVPRVIEYPNGRYELLGDGITTPYQWVWIPRPPPPPPPPLAAPPYPAPPAQQMPPPPTSQSELYRWTDEHGVTTWTDQWDKIPLRYRASARRLDGPPS